MNLVRVSFCKQRCFSSSSSPLPWISPLQLLKPNSQKPDPPPQPSLASTESQRKPKFISHDTAINLIKREKDPQRALQIFNKVSRQKGFTHNSATYGTILHKLAQSKKFQAVDSLLRQMSYETCRFHEGGLCESRRLKEAIELFEEMVGKDQILPDALTYNLLINGFCREGKVDRARKIIEFMKNNGCSPNLFNYSALMNGLCKEGSWEEAKQLFVEMKSTGLKPDTIVYTTLMNCLCRASRIDEVMPLLKEMKENKCEADVVTLNVLLGGLCRESRFHEALQMLEKLPYEGVYLNKASYRIVLNALWQKDEMEKAAKLLGLMLDRGVFPHYATSNEVLIQLCKAGMLDDAVTALFGLAETGFKPEPHCWEFLIEMNCKDRKLLPVFELLDELVIKECTHNLHVGATFA
ncbi:hypothetical protein V6Z11_A07G136000 [Gossypium hirsutum]|uniref:Pentatricopeptide repeat-containing protein At5g18475 isoform X3 n=1 Tax=Gossypium hirsutum TaxID=3635 RepID=A0A1U8NYJ6_GOSHI|nr:pentatricopeptide repeat-containing protein At5g18475 isoform X3 [Gossypium hirsutum]